MKVAVVGGTGQLGKPLVAELTARSDDVLALPAAAAGGPSFSEWPARG